MSAAPSYRCRHWAALAGAALAAAACSPAPPGATLHDPFEADNRAVHAFNQQLADRAPGTRRPAPANPVTRGLANASDNLGQPRRVVNDLLQLRVGNAVQNGYRFVINTTIGLGGVFDPATAIGLTGRDTDFGETLHVWGAPEGAYQELPFIGPSTERRTAGRVVDLALDPLSYALSPRQRNQARALRVAGWAVGRASDPAVETGEPADSYAQRRDAYLRDRRRHLAAPYPPRRAP